LSVERKVCKRCGVEKPITSFQARKTNTSKIPKRRAVCRDCFGQDREISKELKKYILREANYTCYYCGDFGDTVDHIIPRSKGGTDDAINLLCACERCNQLRGIKPIEQFKKEVFKLRK
jgi:5-methylcytosine-specific restriction endonuclease McrA